MDTIRIIFVLIVLIAAPVATAQDMSGIPTPDDAFCAEHGLAGKRNAEKCAILFYSDLYVDAEARMATMEFERVAEPSAPPRADDEVVTIRLHEGEPAQVEQPLLAMVTPSYGYTVYYGKPVGMGIGHLLDAGVAGVYRNDLGHDINVGLPTPIPNGGLFTVVFDDAYERGSKRYTATIYVDLLVELPRLSPDEPPRYRTLRSGRFVRVLPQGNDPMDISVLIGS